MHKNNLNTKCEDKSKSGNAKMELMANPKQN